jgi:hypothetical protein
MRGVEKRVNNLYDFGNCIGRDRIVLQLRQ